MVRKGSQYYKRGVVMGWKCKECGNEDKIKEKEIKGKTQRVIVNKGWVRNRHRRICTKCGNVNLG